MITIAFDMDGTLFDCGDMIGNSWQRAVHEFMRRNNTVMKVPSTEEILNQIGFPPDVLFPKLFPMLDSEGLNEMIDLCTKALCDDIYAGAGRIYDGIPQLLMELKNHDYRIVIASNGDFTYLKSIIKSKNIEKFFEDEIITIDKKTIINKNDILKAYIAKYSDSRMFIMIGDRLSDLNAAKANETHFIGCAFGHAGDEEFKGEKYIVHSVSELETAIKQIAEG